ncbi:hypothetical protein ACFS5M_09180 [Lacinutrix iliipiscaria]|uniref:Uncharacterized protein n=1 Tax=Lacinutrix iliipiscaria TaxID=1230532 RepID=A0ABW5WRM7_9FLAO
MKSDIYLKIVLTIIAINLTFATLKDVSIIPEAHANSISELNNNVTIPTNEDGSINVKILPSETINVNLTQIDGSQVPTTTKYYMNGTPYYPMIVANAN